MPFKGRPPGSGSGEMSRRTQALRPNIALEPKEAAKARALRRQGLAPGEIAQRFNVPVEEVEKALVQMRSPRPESTRGTLNVTLAAHRFVMAERQGEEPLWQTVDRLVDELMRLRQQAVKPAPAARKPREAKADELLPGLLPDMRPEPGPH
ncbi:hypothetical protein [Paracraurococcus lichenis]|uniref:DUF3071 domain-containing protein n=1 Tax=Paracraurococcus lichenis TaxID=3064888 RepID=A0ABT9E2N6_9PROT|nr:hypothetical protein [Paracraurococcus sp. LOR1-02]MDO9710265.1 hypothetical protein [Paracraurococcus sp. LOR1-02]